MSSQNSKRINIGDATYQAMMGRLKEHIDKITLLNLQNLSSQSCKEDRQTILEKLFSHELYSYRAMGTLNNSFKIVAREPKIDESSAYERMVTTNSPSSVTLIGVPDTVKNGLQLLCAWPDS